MQNGGAPAFIDALNSPRDSQNGYQRDSIACGSKVLASSIVTALCSCAKAQNYKIKVLAALIDKRPPEATAALQVTADRAGNGTKLCHQRRKFRRRERLIRVAPRVARMGVD